MTNTTVNYVHFDMYGTDFTRLLRDFIREGSFNTAYKILTTGATPLDASRLRLFFLGRLKFEGQHSVDGGFDAITLDETAYDEPLSEILHTALRTLAATVRGGTLDLDEMLSQRFLRKVFTSPRIQAVQEHIKALYAMYSREEVINVVYPRLIEAYGTVVDTIPENFNGIILSDGTAIEIMRQTHRDVYPILSRLDLVDNADWLESRNTLHVSWGQISGYPTHELMDWEDMRSESKVTLAMVMTVFRARHHLEFHSFRGGGLGRSIVKYFELEANGGGKFGKLAFLKKCYPRVKTPKISKTALETVVDGVSFRVCLRTSPKYSVPGLLTSKFDITETSIQEIEAGWERVKDIRKDNELHWFFQEYIEGDNGVAHYRDDLFSYSLSKERGKTVQGRAGTETLTPEQADILKTLAKDLYDITWRNIQLEFVRTPDGEIYVVQFRYLNKARESRNFIINKKLILFEGSSFSNGRIMNLSPSDVLIIDGDIAHPDELAGLPYKALLVRNNSEFSHALALSIPLRIPSMHGVGNVTYDDLPEQFTIDTLGKRGYILKQPTVLDGN